MNVDENFSVPNVSFRLAFPFPFPFLFSPRGAILCAEVSVQYNDSGNFYRVCSANQWQRNETGCSEELMPLSTAAFRMMLCISMNNDVSQYENMTGHTTRA